MNDSSKSRTVTANDLHQQVGQTFVSHWFVVDQYRIDASARVFEDEQFLHVDPEQARRTPPALATTWPTMHVVGTGLTQSRGARGSRAQGICASRRKPKDGSRLRRIRGTAVVAGKCDDCVTH
jgi:acyl dehydratase